MSAHPSQRADRRGDLGTTNLNPPRGPDAGNGVRNLILLRHAKSDWSNPALADHDRPLARRGRKAALRIAADLARWAPVPDIILCSTSRRTVETADLVAPDGVRRELLHSLYHAGPGAILETLKHLPGSVRTAMIIGHNPGMEDLVTSLAGDLPWDRFPTCAYGLFGMNADWSFVRCLRLVRPRDL